MVAKPQIKLQQIRCLNLLYTRLSLLPTCHIEDINSTSLHLSLVEVVCACMQKSNRLRDLVGAHQCLPGLYGESGRQGKGTSSGQVLQLELPACPLDASQMLHSYSKFSATCASGGGGGMFKAGEGQWQHLQVDIAWLLVLKVEAKTARASAIAFNLMKQSEARSHTLLQSQWEQRLACFWPVTR